MKICSISTGTPGVDSSCEKPRPALHHHETGGRQLHALAGGVLVHHQALPHVAEDFVIAVLMHRDEGADVEDA